MPSIQAADPPPLTPALSQGEREERIEAAIRSLDAAAFDSRQKAFADLADLSSGDAAEQFLSVAQRALARNDLSLEARRQLTQLAEPRAKVPQAAPDSLDEAELDRLVAALGSQDFGQRLSARSALASAIQRPGQAGAVMRRLKRELADPSRSMGQRQSLVELCDLARGHWAASDPQTWKLPQVSDEQIGQWLDVLSQGEANRQASRVSIESATRELFDLACRDEYLPRVRQLVSERLESTKADEPRERLSELADLLRPALAAEIWSGAALSTIQYMHVGVPQRPVGGLRPSHFGPVDEKTAHCVSGNNLISGRDYPVGLAVLNPNRDTIQDDIVFHLVYLPNPRRHLMHRHDLRRPDAQRWRDLSQRTVDALAAEKRRLSGREVLLLAQLDAVVVSRFAVAHFEAVDDGPLAADEDDPFFSREKQSAFQLVCQLLVARGTRVAADGLEKAVRQGRIGKGAAEASAIGWWALVSILRRDPPRDVDERLLRLVERKDLLLPHSEESQADVGATAAALLLARHGGKTEDYGLTPALREPEPRNLPMVPYQFDKPERRQEIIRWWKERREPPASGKAVPEDGSGRSSS